jgi:hypothetical protein
MKRFLIIYLLGVSVCVPNRARSDRRKAPSAQAQDAPQPAPQQGDSSKKALPLQVRIGEIQSGEPYPYSFCGSGPGFEPTGNEWHEPFQYEIISNQEANVTVRVTFMAGAPYVATDHVIQGTNVVKHHKKIGVTCLRASPDAIPVTKAEIVTATLP